MSHQLGNDEPLGELRLYSIVSRPHVSGLTRISTSSEPIGPQEIHMADVFISYHHTDEVLAKRVYQYLIREGVNPFLACVSVHPGKIWEPSIRYELKGSPWVVLLASRAACGSPIVMQEMGGAWVENKQILPVIWEMAPEEIPGFLKKYQVLDLRHGTVQDLELAVSKLASQIKADKGTGLLLLGGLLAAALFAMSQTD